MDWEILKGKIPTDMLTKLLKADEINILISGVTGVGKSSLINALVGVKDLAQEGNGPTPMTAVVTRYEALANGVRIYVWDSPGLQDGTDQDDAYIADMKAKCSSYDLVLFCSSIQSTRFPVAGDKKSVTLLTNAYGNEFWTRAVYVLTYANNIPPGKDKQKPITLESKFPIFKQAIPKMLIESGVDEAIAKSVPVVPAGYIDGEGSRSLSPICEDWLDHLWYTSLLRMRFGGQIAMIKYTANRIKRDEDITSSDLSKPADQQPIGFSGTKVLKYGLPPLFTTILGGIAGFVLGGPVGAVVGVAAGAAIGGATNCAVYLYSEQ